MASQKHYFSFKRMTGKAASEKDLLSALEIPNSDTNSLYLPSSSSLIKAIKTRIPKIHIQKKEAVQGDANPVEDNGAKKSHLWKSVKNSLSTLMAKMKKAASKFSKIDEPKKPAIFHPLDDLTVQPKQVPSQASKKNRRLSCLGPSSSRIDGSSEDGSLARSSIRSLQSSSMLKDSTSQTGIRSQIPTLPYNENSLPGSNDRVHVGLVIEKIEKVPAFKFLSSRVTSTKRPEDIRLALLLGLAKLQEASPSISFYETKGAIMVQYRTEAHVGSLRLEGDPRRPSLSESISVSDREEGIMDRKGDHDFLDICKSRRIIFQMRILRISLLNMHALKFTKLEGDTWSYKEIVSNFLDLIKI